MIYDRQGMCCQAENICVSSVTSFKFLNVPTLRLPLVAWRTGERHFGIHALIRGFELAEKFMTCICDCGL